jgi:hypothetical protein
MGRLERERLTIRRMVEIHCWAEHGQRQPCADCAGVLAYALKRIDHCPHPVKPTCAKCTVHCYQADMRERIRTIMRRSGPRMLLHHPWLSLMHLWWDGRRSGVLAR